MRVIGQLKSSGSCVFNTQKCQRVLVWTCWSRSSSCFLCHRYSVFREIKRRTSPSHRNRWRLLHVDDHNIKMAFTRCLLVPRLSSVYELSNMVSAFYQIVQVLIDRPLVDFPLTPTLSCLSSRQEHLWALKYPAVAEGMDVLIRDTVSIACYYSSAGKPDICSRYSIIGQSQYFNMGDPSLLGTLCCRCRAQHCPNQYSSPGHRGLQF